MGRIHAVAADDPHLALVAGVIRQAVDDAAAGDPEARAWLAGDACLVMLTWLPPGQVDPAAVQARLVARLPPARPWQTGMPLDGDAA